MVRGVFLVTCALSIGLAGSHATGCARGTPEAGVAAKPDPVTPQGDAATTAPSPLPSVEEPVVEPATPSKPLSPTACNKLWDHAQHTVEAAYSAASKKCAADSDCEAVHLRACLADCNSAAIARTSSAAYAKVRATIEATDCKAWFDGACVTKTPMPIPSCPMYVPTCASGTCGTRHGP